MAKKKECYISIDIETDGPIPGKHSMLSLGAAAFVGNRCVKMFYCNIYGMLGTTSDPDTVEWWLQQDQSAYDSLLVNRQHPTDAMERFAHFVQSCETYGDIVPVAAPAVFDYPFIRYYAEECNIEIPGFNHRCIDVKSYWHAYTGIPYNQIDMDKLPEELMPEVTLWEKHNALSDAINQGIIFMCMRRWARGKKLFGKTAYKAELECSC